MHFFFSSSSAFLMKVLGCPKAPGGVERPSMSPLRGRGEWRWELKGQMPRSITQKKALCPAVVGCFAMFHTEGMLQAALCQQLGLKASNPPRFHRWFFFFFWLF